MNVYDKTHELARALKECQEVKDYKSRWSKIKSNDINKKMVDDFREKQIEIYSLQMQGKEPSKEQMEAVNNLWNVINLNSEVKEFMGSEMVFSRLWEDIMKILGESVELESIEDVK